MICGLLMDQILSGLMKTDNPMIIYSGFFLSFLWEEPKMIEFTLFVPQSNQK